MYAYSTYDDIFYFSVYSYPRAIDMNNSFTINRVEIILGKSIQYNTHVTIIRVHNNKHSYRYQVVLSII